MQLLYNGAPLSINMSVSSSDPVGTVIAFMGTEAPENFLVCDGAEHPISKYPELSSLFLKSFGSTNYFGGDGVSTFAVPDLRNLFLRGYHGDAAESLSAGIGKKQSATRIPNVYLGSNLTQLLIFTNDDGTSTNPITNADTMIKSSDRRSVNVTASSTAPSEYTASFTTRPANMAVLFCIRAVSSASIGGGNSSVKYSMEEKIVGTWYDGRPVYQQTHILEGDAKQGSDFIRIFDYPARTTVIDSEGFFWRYWNNEPQYESYMFSVPYIQMDNSGKAAISVSIGSSYTNTMLNVWLATYFDFACPYKAEITLRYVKSKEGESE